MRTTANGHRGLVEWVLIAAAVAVLVGMGLRSDIWWSTSGDAEASGPAVPTEPIALRGEIAGSIDTASLAVVVSERPIAQ